VIDKIEMNLQQKDLLKNFVEPFYKEKDIMHDITHIERVKLSLDQIIENENVDFDHDILFYALYFHGFIYSHEVEIRNWLMNENINTRKIELIIEAAYGSQKDRDSISIEGKLLHDAHEIEGGETFLYVKPLITGSVRGQSLFETIAYIETIIDSGFCYFEHSKKILKTQKKYLKYSFQSLAESVGYK